MYFVLLLVSLLSFTSCDKEEEMQNENQNNQQNDSNQENLSDENGEETDVKKYVDLGLPSGTLWATCNVGATKPEEYGYLFAWGEIKPKSKPSIIYGNYKWGDIDGHALTKYCTWESSGIVDNKKCLDPEDDAAIAQWGKDWRMPTIEEISELCKKCDWEVVYDYKESGVAGAVGISKINANEIFLPAIPTTIGYDGGGEYWSSDINIGNSYEAMVLWFHLDSSGDGAPTCFSTRRDGCKAVRAVYVGK